MKDIQSASCRVAFAALVHDLGKFAERARIDEAHEKDAEGNKRIDIQKQLYCPQWNGHYTHIHAAYTALAIDLIEDQLPPIKGKSPEPFASWKGTQTDDSLINAAARHHKPETALQWIIATADRLASGFERESFEKYNQSPEGAAGSLNHYTQRLLTLFEQLDIATNNTPRAPTALKWRYPLAPLKIESLFPLPADDVEQSNNKAAQQEYRKLWNGFRSQLADIPPSHRNNWSLWLDHFDALLATYTSSIPSATAGGVKPDVSLYDHSRTTAALATALWRFHADEPQHSVQQQLRAQWDAERQDGPLADTAWNTEKFLLIMGDFFGIQPFIFASGGETQKRAAKLLRGRSAYVSLLSECAALRILDELGLPPTSQVINAAGKFLIVAPNRPEILESLQKVQKEFDEWFLQHTWGESGIGLSWTPATAADFRSYAAQETPPFASLINRLFQQLENAKSQRFQLCADKAPAPVFHEFLSSFDPDKGVCAINGRAPAEVPLENEQNVFISRLSQDQINLGRLLTTRQRILITRNNIQANTLAVPLLGYYISLTGDQEASGQFGRLASEGELRRAWDFSLPTDETQPLFNGYARRAINAYIPLKGDFNEWEAERYAGLEEDEPWIPTQPKSLEHLARDALYLDENGRWTGTEALHVLKGDVDNLGTIFERGLARPSFAKWAALSRQMNAFFTLYLPWLCRNDYPDTYTVFAGGDDFFLIGPWRQTVELAQRMHDDFQRYVAENPGIHFSAGLVMCKPRYPIRQLAESADDALERAKALPGKNAITLFDQTIFWQDFQKLLEIHEHIEQLAKEHDFSTRYLYGLLDLTAMADNLHSPNPQPQNAIWRAWFTYRTVRMLERRYPGADNRDRRRSLTTRLAQVLGDSIDKWGNAMRIPLSLYLYQRRSTRR